MRTEKGQVGKSTRREALGAGAVLAAAALVPGVHAAQGSGFKVGLIGCGGRGTGAAVQALKADGNSKITALGDLFPDRIENSRRLLARDEEIGKRVDVPMERAFTGIDAYQKVIASGVDVVLLATPPNFRPLHIEAAVKAGKHVFAEKPVAVDAPGVRRVLASCDEARAKNLCIVSGLCWRYEFGVRAVMKEVHAGRLGRITSVQSVYNASLPGKPWPMIREKNWSDMEWQLRNWYWFTWLSGDHIVEQAVHSIDKG
ncbi:MAG: Gfo/Idh/MocA family oxidoreductase [Gemmataceae bacterium]|nr:Gfo/Idh/MocA family oxidoreductase [Gemmataceae bacterium]